MKNNITSQTERVFNQTKSLWNSIVNNSEEADNFNENFISQFPLLDIVDAVNSVVAIFNYTKFHPEFITKNVREIVGLNQEDLLIQGSPLLYNSLHPTHNQIFLILAKQLQLIFINKDYNENSNLLATTCGVKFVHPEKGGIRILMQMYYIDNDAQNLPIRSIVTMRDVTHLMKSDAYFIRNIYGDKHQYVQVLHSDPSISTAQNDILSLREKEVLHLISKDKDNDEIAETLGISRNTVRNHRQNMLDRLGARDTTALLELARICHII